MTERTNEELSAEIARRLFGLVECSVCAGTPEEHIVGMMDYASDHNAAMGLVVPEMRRQGWRFEAVDFNDGIDVGFVKVGISKWAGCPFDELPRAVCEAALAALRVEGTE